MKIFITELKKTFISNKSIYIIAFAFLLQIAICFIPKITEHPYSVEIYKRYTSELQGEFTAEKEKILLDRQAEISEIIALEEQTEQDYLADKITIDEYSDYNSRLMIAKSEEQTVNYLLEKFEYLNSATGFDKEIFYDTDWADFFSSQGYNFIILMCLLCVLIPIFDKEYSSKIIGLLLTSKHGRTDTYYAKILIAFLTSMFISFGIYMVKFVFFTCKFGNEFADKPLGNLLNYSGFGDVSLSEYYFADVLLKVLAWGVGGVLICLISTVCRNSEFTFFISLFVLAAPSFVDFSVGFSDFTAKLSEYIFLSNQFTGMYFDGFNIWLFAAVIALKLIFYTALGKRFYYSGR